MGKQTPADSTRPKRSARCQRSACKREVRRGSWMIVRSRSCASTRRARRLITCDRTSGKSHIDRSNRSSSTARVVGISACHPTSDRIVACSSPSPSADRTRSPCPRISPPRWRISRTWRKSAPSRTRSPSDSSSVATQSVGRQGPRGTAITPTRARLRASPMRRQSRSHAKSGSASKRFTEAGGMSPACPATPVSKLQQATGAEAARQH